MYQPKVNNTQQYPDSQGNHTVCKGKFLLIGKMYKEPPLDKYIILNKGKGKFPYMPIIISETEEIEVGDWVYNLSQNNLFQLTEDLKENLTLDFVKYAKVLVLPENFSDKHLQAIVDGKMKDGDEVLVKCELYDNTNFEKDVFRIYHGHRSSITLFPAKQSLEEAAKEWEAHMYAEEAFKAGAEWAKKNNY